jgi:hypothetical protein
MSLEAVYGAQWMGEPPNPNQEPKDAVFYQIVDLRMCMLNAQKLFGILVRPSETVLHMSTSLNDYPG